MSTETLNGADSTVTSRAAAADPTLLTGSMVVTQPLEFKFNQTELQSLVKRTGTNMISVTTCAFAEAPGLPKKMYLCAIGHLAPTGNPVTHPENG
jgi:hypothetical protein